MRSTYYRNDCEERWPRQVCSATAYQRRKQFSSCLRSPTHLMIPLSSESYIKQRYLWQDIRHLPMIPPVQYGKKSWISVFPPSFFQIWQCSLQQLVAVLGMQIDQVKENYQVKLLFILHILTNFSCNLHLGFLSHF